MSASGVSVRDIPNPDEAYDRVKKLFDACNQLMPTPAPTILVFDSGLGGLTVYREIAAARPDAGYVYLADDAAFPYGDMPEDALITRILHVIGKAKAEHRPDLVVVACNTASTLALEDLRAQFQVPFVGTVPAIKPACARSKSKRVGGAGHAGNRVRANIPGR